MQAEQRAQINKEEFEPQTRLWPPFTVHGETGGLHKKRRPALSDHYVVVEDLQGGRVVFEVSTWPRIDKGGRLHFEGDPFEIYDDLLVAQERINTDRAADGVTGASRRLRVGDVFAVKGLTTNSKSIVEADRVRDVSLAARNAAKAALYGAVASTVEPEYVERMAIEGPIPEPTYEEGEFDVRQISIAKPFLGERRA